ncbi:GroES-like protein [Mytilinidion resinicola]|uniref:GroES-like protein n=1 Tax=Mytilinidion resinicola TaxID=574789 RepID=A0A6A6Z7D0_9PEZI|nr:GroES-like protein [Mytilinidion resinicola]KAF2816966.1 GroES-like protein [Mytilinidion resinicola]
MSNKAAYLLAAKAHPFKVDDAPMPTPDAYEVVIKNHAVAINPVDWKIQDWDGVFKSYPVILGSDVAGEIAAVGSAVEKFKIGDRVIANMDGLGNQKQTNAGFQLYSATTEKMVAKLPSGISYADGAVLPIGLGTAAAGLFQKTTLDLPYPQLDVKPNGQILLIWGGSSSVGSGAIQLAKAAGFEVAATASSRNHGYLKDLGAAYIFDQSSANVVDEIVEVLKGKDFAGVFDAISTNETIALSAQIASSSSLEGKRFVCDVNPPWEPLPKGLPENVKFGHAMQLDINTNEVGKAVWGEWVTPALEKGLLRCKPNPRIIGHGLEKIQVGVDELRKGVSAEKLVITL